MLAGVYHLLKLDLFKISALVPLSCRDAYYRIFNAENHEKMFNMHELKIRGCFKLSQGFPKDFVHTTFMLMNTSAE